MAPPHLTAFYTPEYCAAFLRRLNRHVDVLYQTVGPAMLCSDAEERARFDKESEETMCLIEAFASACQIGHEIGVPGHVPVASMNSFIQRLCALETYTQTFTNHNDHE